MTVSENVKQEKMSSCRVKDLVYCGRCGGKFTPKTLYWHNYNVIGFFCRKCFDLIVEETGSGPKLTKLRKENG